MHKEKTAANALKTADIPPLFRKKGYDPEMLYVECSRCGAPILWEPGQTAKILQDAGISPLELDASCIILSDGCPLCSKQDSYTVSIRRLAAGPAGSEPPAAGTC
jgi:hypothetical protein